MMSSFSNQVEVSLQSFEISKTLNPIDKQVSLFMDKKANLVLKREFTALHWVHVHSFVWP